MTAKRWPIWPPLAAIGAIVAIGAAALLLDLRASTDDAVSTQIVGGVAWFVWRATAGMSVAIIAILMFWGFGALTRASRWALGEASWVRRLAYLLLGLVFCVGVGVLVSQIPQNVSRVLPINGLLLRTQSIVAVGVLAALPWITLSWLAQSKLRHMINSEVRARTERAGQPTNPAQAVAHHLGEVAAIRQLLTRSQVALGILVALAVLTTAALRNIVLSDLPDRADTFPAENILYYGVGLAMFVAIVVVPALLSWYAAAESLVDRAYPVTADDVGTEAWSSGRSRLEALLGLSTSPLRSPLAVLSVLSPLLTAVLTVLLPDLSF